MESPAISITRQLFAPGVDSPPDQGGRARGGIPENDSPMHEAVAGLIDSHNPTQFGQPDWTPPIISKQAQRASDAASTVYAGVKDKMAAMKAELLSLRDEKTTLKAQVQLAEEALGLEKERAQAELHEKLSEAKTESELSAKRHLGFIDRLLADKEELSRKCEALGGQMRTLEDRYAAGEAKREEAFAKELRKQKELWGQAEKEKREQWLAEKTKEVKDATVRGLEPDIQRLVARHREETRKVEETLREDHRRELAAERQSAQSNLARMQEAGLAELHAALEQERESCAQRIQEMSTHFEEQLRLQRMRHVRAAEAEHEERYELRRREIARLEDELTSVGTRVDAVVATARDERAATHERVKLECDAVLERERQAHAVARGGWQQTLEGELSKRLDKERLALEASASSVRREQVGVVVRKLSVETAEADKAWKAKVASTRAQAETRWRKEETKAHGEYEALHAKYVAAADVQSQLDERLRQMTRELAVAKEAATGSEATAARAQAEAEAAMVQAREVGRLATMEANMALAQAQGERAVVADELAQMREEARAMRAAHADELASVQAIKDDELANVEERARALRERKNEEIRGLQAHLVRLSDELHTSRAQLHAMQQDIIAFE